MNKIASTDIKDNITTIISSKIAHYINNQHTIFVFPTGITANLWADWSIMHPEITGTTAIATERFIAWDTFKSASIKAKKEKLTSIPSVMRKIFATDIIKKNFEAVKKGKPLFNNIITPVYAQSADNFINWIAKILPSLSSWKNKFDTADKTNILNTVSDPENADLITLYKSYKEFLDSFDFFEPAWEQPPFIPDGNQYLLFFPEILEDYSDYKELLKSTEDIQLVTFPDDSPKEKHPIVHFFPNSRTELRIAVLKLFEQHASHTTPWTDMAISVPDLDTYGPYIERELELYAIPYTRRAGTVLTSNSAGQIFNQIKNCVSENFSYTSVRTILLNRYIPWKDETINEKIVKFGNEKKCFLSYKTDKGKQVDSWEETFLHSTPTEDKKEIQKNYYTLKKYLKKMYKSQTFAEIRSAWFAFKTYFLNETDFSEESDNILGRCLMELSVLIDIEKKYFQNTPVPLPSPFQFFVSELNDKLYVPQTQTDGVSLFPYRLSAMCPFEFQIVVDAGQKALTVPFKRLPFLREDKREALNLKDTEQISDNFIRLYAKNDAFFTCAQQTFSGYTVPFSYFNRISANEDKKFFTQENSLFNFDFISKEKDLIRNPKNCIAETFTDYQKQGFTYWGNQNSIEKKNTQIAPETKEKIQKHLFYSIDSEGNIIYTGKDLLHISETDMKYFFTCPHKWLFAKVLKLKEDTLDTDLIDQYTIGNINHKIMELYLTELKTSNKKIPLLFDSSNQESTEILSTISRLFDKAVTHYKNMPLVYTIITSEKDSICQTLENFLVQFSSFFADFTILETEGTFSTPSETDSFIYTGRTDCILCDPYGTVSIIDFKNGKPPEKNDCIINNKNELKDFQIAMYTHLWNQTHKKTQYIENALFFSIKNAYPVVIFGQIQSRIDGSLKKGKLPDKEAFKPTLIVFQHLAHLFAENIQNNDFSAVKKVSFKNCSQCRFATICRSIYTVSGRKNAE